MRDEVLFWNFFWGGGVAGREWGQCSKHASLLVSGVASAIWYQLLRNAACAVASLERCRLGQL